MSRAVLSIGSNLDDRLGHLRSAVVELSPYLVSVSPIYRTPPWGPVEQDDYFNAVLIVDDEDAAPIVWLQRANQAENAAGRTRDTRWGPRTLDVDVITVDQQISDDPVLTLPHPRAAERAFVLVPWLVIDPNAVLPGRGSVATLLAAIPSTEVEQIVLVPEAVLQP
jgi:2-amino-4-hydroxy-6-hydroxymethyldihydropteridine diphosphokinase